MTSASTKLTGKVLVRGNAKLYIGPASSISLKGGSDTIVIQTNASLNIYADTASVDISGQGVQNSGSASQFHYWGTSRNTSLNYGGNGAFTGTIYAPSAYIALGNGGSAALDISGSIVSKSVRLASPYRLHYDEDLKRTGGFY
jgi:hypothetical protein